MEQTELTAMFTQKAEAVSAVVKPVKDMGQALEETVNICAEKQACQVLASGCSLDLSPEAEDLCGLKDWEKIIAAPDLDDKTLDDLQKLCRQNNIALIRQGLHAHLGGIDVGLTTAAFGLAETGTIVQDSASEDLRLATMISESHIALLPASRICAASFDLERQMEEFFSAGAAYLAFITGASRTADIERVLTLGVHGPLELRVLILMNM
ncbi:MAG: lactate utilization protein [Desulfosalsimonas sp.]